MTEPQQFLIYQSEDGSTRIDVMLEAEMLWLKEAIERVIQQGQGNDQRAHQTQLRE